MPQLPEKSFSPPESIPVVSGQIVSDQVLIYLQACALIDEEVSEEIVARCLKEAGLLMNMDYKAFRSSLIKQGYVDRRSQCRPDLQESVARKAATEKYFSPLATAIGKILPSPDPQKKDNAKFLRIRRDLRFAILNRDLDHFNCALLKFFNHQERFSGTHPIVTICNTPFDAHWFSRLPAQIQLFALHEIFKHNLLHLEKVAGLEDYLNSAYAVAGIPEEGKASFNYMHIIILLLQGKLDEARIVIKKAGNPIKSFGLQGCFFSLQGKTLEAIRSYQEELQVLRRVNNRKNAYFTGVEGLFFLLSLLINGRFSDLTVARQIIFDLEKNQPHNIFLPCYLALKDLIECQENPTGFRPTHLQEDIHSPINDVATFFRLVVQYWIEGKVNRMHEKLLSTLLSRAGENGYHWLELELAELLWRMTDEKRFKSCSAGIQAATGLRSLTESIRHEEPWQRALKALTVEDFQLQKTLSKDFRIVWFVRLSKDGKLLALTPKEQKLSIKKSWTKGRIIALKKLLNNQLNYLSDQDRRICGALKRETAPWGYTVEFDLGKALQELIGHPLIFLENGPATPVEFVSGQPELRVEQRNEFIHLTLHPFFKDELFKITEETQTRFKVIAINRNRRRIAGIIGENGLTVPLSAKDKVFSSINMIASQVAIHSSIDGISSTPDRVKAQSRIHIHLLPLSSGFRVSFYVRPFEFDGPYFKPGIGPVNIVVDIRGRRMQTRRDLILEEKNARLIEQACSSLLLPEDETWEWLLADPEQCLQLLYELRALGNTVVIEWPEGKRMTVSPQISFDQFRGRIQKKQNWFQLSGQVKIDESLVLDMRQLLTLAKKTPGRFIPLGHGQFLTLAREFQKRLEEINAFSETRDGGVFMHPLAAMAIDEFAGSGMRLESDFHWKEQLQKIKGAGKYTPSVPSTLQAELRDYQKEGFGWLAQLANWGVGACLADDMGLGKTVQALAIVLHRASGGPTLVVTPTSVCHNWLDEAHRFAPTLRTSIFGGRRRKKLLETLGPFDLLITSYGMLQQETKNLSAIDWQTIVLDEAQAIKNLATKRSRAAKLLSGKFRMITTGTPIENHLGELWNLFHFINPGLLGSLDHFNEQFALPIERHNDKEARLRLRKLIRPFVLRRIKSQVLEELPSRTEVVLKVHLSREETAFYEALRQEALASLMQIKGMDGHRHIKILAEIMRLRLACCNPRLVSEQVKIPSSKLKLFAAIVEELLNNRHKALVFSQFVGHLTLIREYLDQKKINYRYMDGSTPPLQRKREVDAFQAGDGDFFLISLRAGGLGLNLTAADFVIHMDPWWNPAVEDQASDRAHRLGQKHPVTIYRLVSENTIEEKIIKLHKDKKELADSLLEGTEVSGKISTEELLALLQNR
jgi:hypothetical protein